MFFFILNRKVTFCDVIYIFISHMLILNLFTNAEILAKNKLDEFIQHYEILDYEPINNGFSTNRIKRWLEDSSPLEDDDEEYQFRFYSHGRNFHIRLKRDSNVFSKSIQIVTGNSSSSSNIPKTILVEGHLQDDLNSKVFGSIHDGIFHGHILTPNESFSIERTSRFELTNPYLRNSSQHSIIYSHNDIENAIKGVGHLNGCGVTNSVQEWMSNVQNSAIVEDEILEQTHYYYNNNENTKPFTTTYNSNHSILLLQDLIHKSDESSIIYEESVSARRRRVKRNAENTWPSSSASATAAQTTCPLYIRTDPMLWKHIEAQEGTSNPEKVREIILGIVGQHAKAANEMFEGTRFSANGMDFRNMRFEVRKVKIDTYDECKVGYKGPVNIFCEEHIDVSNFLDMHSRSNYDAFCLSYMFTYRDFSGGVVGLAWVASTSSSGGVCQMQGKFLEGAILKERSLNTGIVTFLNYNRQLPPRLSHLTFAHEIGHNYGAPHDPDKCSPGGIDGNYLMYASSTNGYLKNNDKFSKCSIEKIVPVLDELYNSDDRKNCFTASDGAFCGNRIVEETEECDCGFTEECTEKCCFPRISTNRNSCKRKPHAACSYSEGPCCNPDTCGFVQSYKHLECQKETECTETSYCNGAGALCPTPRPKPDNTICNNGTQVCLQGECRGSICLNFNLKECYLSSADYNNDKRALCNVSCADETGNCVSVYERNMPGISRTLSLRPGSPCDNFKGYCDVFMKCRAVDEEGPLLRLKRLIFRKYGFRSLRQWAIEYWWAVILMGIGFLIFMGLFIQCCAVHTPSSNPYMTKSVKFSETMKHPVHSLKRKHKQKKPETLGEEDYRNRETIPLRQQ